MSLLALLGLACTEPAPPAMPPPPPRPQASSSAASSSSPVGPFSALPAGLAQPDGVEVLAGTSTGPLTWRPLLVEGQRYGDGPPFGTVPGMDGQPVALGSASTCHAPDANGILQLHGRTWMLTHVECAPATLVVSELERSAEGWSVTRSRPADRGEGPLPNKLCAGQTTPWGTMIGGEEYETDAALWEDGAVHGTRAGALRYRDDSSYAAWAAGFPSPPSPYDNGWMHESTVVDETGATRSELLYALGRFSHELGRLMPDGRTVYLSDDSSHGMLAMFVADRPGALDRGHLYVSRWTPGDDGGIALSWIDLGHATQDGIAAALAAGVHFDQLFDRSLAAPWGCPDGATRVRGHQGIDECLVLRAGQEGLASRLETRRVAALAGATVELSKEEGLAVDAAGERLFVAFASVASGMLANDPPGGGEHLALAPNPCGVVMALTLEAGVVDSAGRPIDSAHVATRAAPAVEGRPLPGGGCDPAGISGPDNLDFIADAGVLLIAEDSGREPNLLWAWKDGSLLPLMAAPRRNPGGLAEVSGLSFVPDLDGQGWITVSLQHPGERPATVGLLGPLPGPLPGPASSAD